MGIKKYFSTKKELQNYLKKDFSASKIAKVLGRSIGWVLNELKLHKIKYRKWNYGYRCPGWKKGWWIDKDGYKMIFVENHPNKTYKSYVREHRLVMEKKLGRYLTKKEVVHHKNNDKLDNRISNLELFAKNGEHLKKELTGKTPNWTKKGKINIRIAIIKGWKNKGYKLSNASKKFLKQYS